MGKGGLPVELTETDICERFGWTFQQLDNEDQDRVYAGFAMQNIRDSVSRIKDWLDRSGKAHIGNQDMEVWGMLMDAEKELKGNKNG